MVTPPYCWFVHYNFYVPIFFRLPVGLYPHICNTPSLRNVLGEFFRFFFLFFFVLSFLRKHCIRMKHFYPIGHHTIYHMVRLRTVFVLTHINYLVGCFFFCYYEFTELMVLKGHLSYQFIRMYNFHLIF